MLARRSAAQLTRRACHPWNHTVWRSASHRAAGAGSSGHTAVVLSPSAEQPDAALAFSDLDLDAALCGALLTTGISNPTPLQARAIPCLLEGHSALVAAETGSGKTLAFALPLLESVLRDERAADHTSQRRSGPSALFLAPHSTLCAQTTRVVRELLREAGSSQRCVECSGGGHAAQGGTASPLGARGALKAPAIVVATPRALLGEHGTTRNKKYFGATHCVVLDEADLLLRNGFVRDVERLLSLVHKHSGALPQLVLVAASMRPHKGTFWSKAVRNSSTLRKLLPKVVKHTVVSDALHTQRHELEHTTVQVEQERERLPRVAEIIAAGNSSNVLVFAKSPAAADGAVASLSRELNTLAKGTKDEMADWTVLVFHAKLRPWERAEALTALEQAPRDPRAGVVVVCTDALSRGVDLQRPVDMVVQLTPPTDLETHLHRIGRTARMGRSGRALTMVCSADPIESEAFAAIDKAAAESRHQGSDGASRALTRRKKTRSAPQRTARPI